MSAKHLLSIDDLTDDDIESLMESSDFFSEIGKRAIKKVPTLRGKTVVNLFYESSTRTRTSFELAGKRLSADVINISANTSAVSKGESLKDTAKTLNAMNVDAVVIRHSSSGAPHILKNWLDGSVSVINAGDGMHEHPTQALLDLYTLRKEFGKLEGLNVVLVGDIGHSRVARSVIKLFSRQGINVSVFGPQTMIPVEIESFGCKQVSELDKAIKDNDVIYLLRVQVERGAGINFPSPAEYAMLYGINNSRRAMLDSIKIMHPGPVNRGIEISSEIADLSFALIDRQVESGVALRMAVLFRLLAGESGEQVE